MNIIPIICLSALCLLFPSMVHGQSPDSGLQESNTSAFACKLTGEALIKRKAELQREVLSQLSGTRESEKGYVFSFEDKGDMLITLVDYMLAEQSCCPFFQFDLNIKPNHGGIEFGVSGPPKAKEMVGLMLKGK